MAHLGVECAKKEKWVIIQQNVLHMWANGAKS